MALPPLPKHLYVGGDAKERLYVTIEEKEMVKMGEWDGSRGVISINANLPPFGKWTILIHELIHVAEDQCLETGALKRRIGEKAVTNIAGLLSAYLGINGLIAGMNAEEATEAFLQELLNTLPESVA